jgi:hypothetical protein
MPFKRTNVILERSTKCAAKDLQFPLRRGEASQLAIKTQIAVGDPVEAAAFRPPNSLRPRKGFSPGLSNQNAPILTSEAVF